MTMSTEGIILAAPPGTVWPLDLDQFEAALNVQYGDIPVVRTPSAIADDTYLMFAITIDGEPRNATYSSRGVLSLADASPLDWAPTIVWLLSLLPTGVPVVTMTDQHEEPVVLPGDRTPESLNAFLEQLAAE
jgi:hypothetical protein